jgi:hypothetical protein
MRGQLKSSQVCLRRFSILRPRSVGHAWRSVFHMPDRVLSGSRSRPFDPDYDDVLRVNDEAWVAGAHGRQVRTVRVSKAL